MTYEIVTKYIKDLSFKIKDAKSYFLLEKDIKNYTFVCDIKSIKLKEKIIQADINLRLIPVNNTSKSNLDVKVELSSIIQFNEIGSKDEMETIVITSLKKAGLFNEVKNRLLENGTSLSGGQQQRLCIARAIAVSPEIILMDEPCSALDPIATAIVEELIDELVKNYTIVIVTHSMQQAARVSQQTAFFHMGSLIEVGSTEKIFSTPQHKQTQDYITGKIG